MAKLAVVYDSLTGFYEATSIATESFTYEDNVPLGFGTGAPVQYEYDTVDPNANHLKVQLPAGGAVDVPVLAFGIAIINVNQGLFDGFTQPMVALFDADVDSYLGFHYSADDVAVVRMRLAAGTVRNHILPDVVSDTFALLAATQTLAAKTLTAPDINAGTADSLTSLSIRSTGAAFDLTFATDTVFTAGRTLTVRLGDAARILTFSADATIGGTNTGDQTITLTGGVTGSGTGSFAATVITNANLTGPITSVGNATAVATQTGTGSVFVMQASPTLTTPNLGTPSAGVMTNVTGTAAGLTAGNVTTNANLTGPITSVGNATSVAAQTGTGSVFVMQASPSLTTPALGTPSSVVLTNATGTAASLTAGLATDTVSKTGTGSVYVTNTSPTLVTPVLGVATATSLQAIIGNVTPAAGTFTTLNATASFEEAVVVLTDGATPALDASLGNIFTLAAVGNRTIAVPTNATSGQKIVIRHLASGAARTLALNAGAGGFRFGTDVTALTETASGKYDYIGCIYNAAASFWDVIAYVKGY